MRRILAICTSHIGGVLLMTPALELLHEFFPGAEISVLVRRGTETVLQNNPRIQQIYTDGEITSNQQMHQSNKASLARRWSQVPRGLRLIRELRRQHFDLAIDFNGSDRAAILAFFSGAKARVGFKDAGGFLGKPRLFTELYPTPDQRKHRVLQVTDLIFQLAQNRPECASIHPAVGGLVLKPTTENLNWAEAQWNQHAGHNGPRILLHPTSRVTYKCWAPGKWAEVIARLQKDFHGQVMLTSSPNFKEIEMAEAVLNAWERWRPADETSATARSARPHALLGNLNLGQLAALIQCADLFLGVDSAPMHIAAAVGTPVIAIFGPSNEGMWAPWGNAHRVVRRPCRCLELQKTLCSPEKGMDCLNNIPADEVYQAAAAALSSSARPAKP